MKVKDKLRVVDQDLNSLVAEIKECAKNAEFTEICEFEITDEILDIPWERLSGKGLYLFEIKNKDNYEIFDDWLDHFKDKWENKLYKKRFVPNFTKKYYQKHTEIEDWIPFYLGKRNDLYDRVKSHLYYPLERNTFAMKLMARENMKNEIFRLSIIKLDIENYDVIAPIMEKQLRTIINPVVGR